MKTKTVIDGMDKIDDTTEVGQLLISAICIIRDNYKVEETGNSVLNDIQNLRKEIYRIKS